MRDITRSRWDYVNWSIRAERVTKASNNVNFDEVVFVGDVYCVHINASIQVWVGSQMEHKPLIKIWKPKRFEAANAGETLTLLFPINIVIIIIMNNHVAGNVCAAYSNAEIYMYSKDGKDLTKLDANGAFESLATASSDSIWSLFPNAS